MLIGEDSLFEMNLMAAPGMSPVRVKNADGMALPVPWEAPAPTGT